MSDGDGGSQAPESAAFMNALVTEHFTAQTASSATITEGGSRATLYLSSLSSGLVAIGFASSSRKTLAALSFSVFPTVFAVGWFTYVRLIETALENIVLSRRIELIRRHYAGIDSRFRYLFAPNYGESGVEGVRYRGRSVLFMMASMVLLINSALGGATVTLLCLLAADTTGKIATPIGVAVGIVFLAAGLTYEYRRLGPEIRRDTETLRPGD